MPRFLFVFLLALAACSPVTEGFDVVVTNTGDETVYLHAGDSSGLMLLVEEEIDGEWVGLSTFFEGMCTRRCSDPPTAPIVCADAAAELLRVHALLPGDSASKSFDGEFWYLTPRGCAKRAPLTGDLRVTLWHDDVAVDINGDPVAEPDESGPMGSGGEEVMLEEADEASFPIVVEDFVAEVQIDG